MNHRPASAAAALLILLFAAARLVRGDEPASPRSINAPGATLQKLATGFAFTEGPSSDAAGNIYFTDQPNDRIHKYDTAGKLTTFLEPAGRSNGTCFDSAGNLITCADDHNQLWSIRPDGSHTILITDYQGKLLNGPNDVWVRPDGGIYLTDPYYKRDYWSRTQPEIPALTYYLSPDRKLIVPVSTDLKKPNGIIGTPDGKTLYIADIGGDQTYQYDIQPDGTLTHKRLFCPMGSDGMTIDSEGNLYLTGHGVTVFDTAGQNIQHIPIDEKWTGNICFGGAGRTLLFITASNSIYGLQTRTHGVGSQ